MEKNSQEIARASLEKKEEIWPIPVIPSPSPLHPKKKSNATTQQRHQELRLHNGCGPT